MRKADRIDLFGGLRVTIFAEGRHTDILGDIAGVALNVDGEDLSRLIHLFGRDYYSVPGGIDVHLGTTHRETFDFLEARVENPGLLTIRAGWKDKESTTWLEYTYSGEFLVSWTDTIYPDCETDDTNVRYITS